MTSTAIIPSEHSLKRIQEYYQDDSVESRTPNHIESNYNFLISLLIDTFGFRKNLYQCVGSYDLVSWVLLCFNSLYNTNEKIFKEILMVIAYLSIVDDALDEKYTPESIVEMTLHSDILSNSDGSIIMENPATRFVAFMKNMVLKENDSFYNFIKDESVEFLRTGIELLKKGQCTTGLVTSSELNQFLIERRVDSMSKLFIGINLKVRGLDCTSELFFTEYSDMACDVISIVNDIASLGKDVKNGVTNNYLMLHTCMARNIDRSQLLKNLTMSDFNPSLETSLDLIEKMIEQMKKIKASNPSFIEHFTSVDEIVKGYCAWCFTSPRFQQKEHILDHFKIKSANGLPNIPFKLFGKFDMDKNTYFDDHLLSQQQINLN